MIVLSIATFCLETLPELKRYQRVSVNETAAVGTTDDVGLVRSGAREVDDRVRTNEPFFDGRRLTIWNDLEVIACTVDRAMTVWEWAEISIEELSPVDDIKRSGRRRGTNS